MIKEELNESETRPQPFEVIDGWLIDVETCEIVGHAEEQPEFTVHDEDSANWVLGKMLDTEAQLAAVETSAEVIRAGAVLENAERLRKEQQRRLDWLHRRFDNELGEYARQRLAGQKTKTLKTLLGSISLRVKKGGVKVRDAEKALHWAKFACPEAVKVSESFLISLVPDEVKRLIAENPEDFASFEVTRDEEVVTVKTGVQP